MYFHRARGRERVAEIGPDYRFYAELLAYPFRVRREAGGGWRAPLHAALLGVSQATYAAGFFVERGRAQRAR